MKDFSYLEKTLTTRRTIFLMGMCIGFMVAILMGMFAFSNFTEQELKYVDTNLLLGIYAAGLIMSLIGIIVLIHYFGGVKPKDILYYQIWCQEQFKKTKQEKNKHD